MSEDTSFQAKLADHAFEIIKFFISIVMFLATLYVAMLGAYFAYIASSSAASTGSSALSYFMLAISCGVVSSVWVFYHLSIRAAKHYARYLVGMSGKQGEPEFERAMNSFRSVGLKLSVSATVSVALASLVVWLQICS